MSSTKIICTAFLSIFLFFQVAIVSASSIQQVAIDDMLETAEIIFEGQVTNVESRWNNKRTSISTFVTFEILDVIYGPSDQKTIELRFSGGQADGLVMEIEGLIYPREGEQGIYFVEDSTQRMVNPIVGWSQGHYLIESDATGEQKMMTATRRPITEMTNEKVQRQTFSNGVAAGVKTNNASVDDNATMSKNRFKQNLKDRLLNRAGR